MNDIVERLKSRDLRHADFPLLLRAEAHDEIVRLRAERDEARTSNAALEARVLRLSGSVQTLSGLVFVDPMEPSSPTWKDRAFEAEAERDRLRDALTKTEEERAQNARPVILAALKGDTP